MALDKQDLREIKKIVDGSVNTAIEKSEIRMTDKMEFLIEKSEMRTREEIKKTVTESKDEIIKKMDREVSDLAQNDREIMEKIGDKFENHEKRITKIENKMSIAI